MVVLQKLMENMGFSDKWVNHVISRICITVLFYRNSLNGKKTQEAMPGRGPGYGRGSSVPYLSGETKT